jgi:predicted ATPase
VHKVSSRDLGQHYRFKLGLGELDDQQVRQRAFGALRELLCRISDRAAIVWFIDDLQWGDADSAELLFEVLRPPEAPAVLLVGSYRSDEAGSSAFFRMWDDLQSRHNVSLRRQDIELLPLTMEECTELVVSSVGRDGDEIRRQAIEFAKEAGGNAFLVSELASCFDPEQNGFQTTAIHEVLEEKLRRLPEEAGQLLEVIAVSGQPLSLNDVVKAAGCSPMPVSVLTRMRSERIIRSVGPDERPLLDTYHDRIREIVLAQMDDGRASKLHLQLAGIIEASISADLKPNVTGLDASDGQATSNQVVSPRVYDLSYHFDAAGEKKQACHYALLAARQAREQFALQVASEQYAIGLRNAGEASKAVRFRIAVGYGEALMLSGRYDQALALLEGADVDGSIKQTFMHFREKSYSNKES